MVVVFVGSKEYIGLSLLVRRACQLQCDVALMDILCSNKADTANMVNQSAEIAQGVRNKIATLTGSDNPLHSVTDKGILMVQSYTKVASMSLGGQHNICHLLGPSSTW